MGVLWEKVLATSLVLCYTTNVAKKHVCGFLPRCLSRDRSFVRLRRRVKHTEEKNQMEENNMSVISMKQLLEAGVHFGHQTRRWNPKMAPYIYTERNGIYIIDLQKSVGMVDDAYKAVSDIAAEGGTVLFVGTKKQAQDAIKAEAERCGMYYVNERWLGGNPRRTPLEVQAASYLAASVRISSLARTSIFTAPQRGGGYDGRAVQYSLLPGIPGKPKWIRLPA